MNWRNTGKLVFDSLQAKLFHVCQAAESVSELVTEELNLALNVKYNPV